MKGSIPFRSTEVALNKKTFSKEWTDKEKLLLVIIVTDIIRKEIHKGQYNTVGRPNIQAVHEMILATPAQLEQYRDTIESLIDEYGRDRAFPEDETLL